MAFSIQGYGDAATFKTRAESISCVKSCNADNMSALVGMLYGSWGPQNAVYQSVNYQAGGNYINDEQYVASVDDENDVLYKEDGIDSFLEWDHNTGKLTVKDAKDVATDCGLTTEDGDSVANTIVLGKNSLNARTYQYRSGVSFDSEKFDLNQSAFNSKWAGAWTRYNLDWDKVSDNPSSQEEYDIAVLANEAMYENEQILTESEYQELAKCTTDIERYELFLKFLKVHSFEIQNI